MTNIDLGVIGGSPRWSHEKSVEGSGGRNGAQDPLPLLSYSFSLQEVLWFFFMTTGGQTFTVFGLPASHKIRVIPNNYFLAKSASFKTVEIISPSNIAFIQPRIALIINRYTAYNANAHHKTVPRPSLRPAIFLSCDKKFTFPCGRSRLLVGSRLWQVWVWLKQISYASRPATRQTIQIWVVTRHLYGISALVSQTSFRGETGGGVVKYRLFPEADKCWLVSLSILKVGMFVTFVYSIKDNPAKNIWNWLGPCCQSADP